MNADGSGFMRLGPALAWTETGVAWSAEGTEIAVAAEDRIWVVRADGSGRRPLVETEGQQFDPQWSPDGRHIAFVVGLF